MADDNQPSQSTEGFTLDDIKDPADPSTQSFGDRILVELRSVRDDIREWMNPKTTFPIVFTPFFITFLAAVFLFDLAMSHLYAVSQGNDFVTDLQQRGFQIDVNVLADLYWGGLVYTSKGPAQLFLTYCFHHFNLPHIIGNSILLSLSMYLLEERYGALRILILGIFSAFSGSLISFLVYKGQNKILAGASAIAYGYLGTFIGDMIINWSHYRQRLIWVTLLVGGTIISIIIEATALPDVSAIAHAAGVVTCILVAVVLLPNYNLPVYERVIQVICGILLLAEFLVIPLVIAFSIKM